MDEITEFIKEYGTPELRKDKLTEAEWKTIKNIKDFLEKLSMATKACESKHSTLDLVLPLMDYILSAFKKAKQTYSNDLIIALMFNSS